METLLDLDILTNTVTINENTLTNFLTINDIVDDYELREDLQEIINVLEDTKTKLKGLRTEDQITLFIRGIIDLTNKQFGINS